MLLAHKMLLVVVLGGERLLTQYTVQVFGILNLLHRSTKPKREYQIMDTKNYMEQLPCCWYRIKLRNRWTGPVISKSRSALNNSIMSWGKKTELKSSKADKTDKRHKVHQQLPVLWRQNANAKNLQHLILSALTSQEAWLDRQHLQEKKQGRIKESKITITW